MGWEVKWEAREEISRGHHLIDKTYLWAHTEDTHWKYHREKCGQEERLLDSEWSYNMGWVRFLNIRVLTITGPYIKLRIQTKKNILLRCKRRGSNIIHGRENSHISSFTPHHCPPMRIFSFTLVWILDPKIADNFRIFRVLTLRVWAIMEINRKKEERSTYSICKSGVENIKFRE